MRWPWTIAFLAAFSVGLLAGCSGPEAVCRGSDTAAIVLPADTSLRVVASVLENHTFTSSDDATWVNQMEERLVLEAHTAHATRPDGSPGQLHVLLRSTETAGGRDRPVRDIEAFAADLVADLRALGSEDPEPGAATPTFGAPTEWSCVER